MTPVLAVKPDWKVRTAGVPLNSASSASSASCIDIVPAIVRTAPLPDAELADGRERGLAQPRVVGQAEVVVRREADQPAVVDRDDRALRRRHDPERPVEVAFPERGDLVVEEARGDRLSSSGVVRHVTVQSMMTLPESPDRAAANAASKSRNAEAVGDRRA